MQEKVMYLIDGAEEEGRGGSTLLAQIVLQALHGQGVGPLVLGGVQQVQAQGGQQAAPLQAHPPQLVQQAAPGRQHLGQLGGGQLQPLLHTATLAHAIT